KSGVDLDAEVSSQPTHRLKRVNAQLETDCLTASTTDAPTVVNRCFRRPWRRIPWRRIPRGGRERTIGNLANVDIVVVEADTESIFDAPDRLNNRSYGRHALAA